MDKVIIASMLSIVLSMFSFTNCFGDIKAVLFDCDGTLVDSEYAHYMGWKQALDDLGYHLTLEEYGQCVGQSVDKISQFLASKAGKGTGDMLLDRKRIYFRNYSRQGLPSIVHTVDFLKTLAAQKNTLGIKIGVCSAAQKDDLLVHLRHLKIDHLLDLVLSGNDDLHEYSDPEGVNKPKPYIYMHALKMLGVSPNEAVVIEDSSPGVQAGISAGCFTIAIPNEFTKHHDLNHSNWKIDTLEQMQVDNFFLQVKTIQTK